METEPVHKHFPKVKLGRRGAAFLIDYWVVALLSSLGGDPNTHGVEWGQALLFLLLWLGMRVILSTSNQGQSLGRWAFDIKVIDLRFGKTPLLQNLLKREAITGIGAALTAVGLSHLTPGHGAGMLLLLPLAIDCTIAKTDPFLRQTFHDRIAHTIVVATRRGFSLDIKMKKWNRQLRHFYQETVQNRSKRDFD